MMRDTQPGEGAMSDLYAQDILVWSERQAELLRRLDAGQPTNERPDWANIIEEIEDVGRRALHAVESLLAQALRHWLKAEAWPASRDASPGVPTRLISALRHGGVTHPPCGNGLISPRSTPTRWRQCRRPWMISRRARCPISVRSRSAKC
jgi:hypothetical protein